MRGAGDVRAAFVIDAATGIRADTLMHVLEPWRAWLDVVDLRVGATPPSDDWLAGAAANGAEMVAPVSESADFHAAVVGPATAHGLRVVACGYEAGSEREAALLHEMCHHHYELGGLNEWDGAPVQYSIGILQGVSAANCVTQFPQYLIDDLRARRAELRRPLEALDVGSGAGSRLRWGVLQNLVHVTAVDPLLDVYAVLLAHHGLDRLPGAGVGRAIAATAESLDQHVAPSSFDLVFCSNALDHVEDPPAVIGQMARVLRPGGLLALEFFSREGSRQNWQQLHQFDLFLAPATAELKCQWRDGRVEALVPGGLGLATDRVVSADDEKTVVVLSA